MSAANYDYLSHEPVLGEDFLSVIDWEVLCATELQSHTSANTELEFLEAPQWPELFETHMFGEEVSELFYQTFAEELSKSDDDTTVPELMDKLIEHKKLANVYKRKFQRALL
jgi:hypothetical protein